jgi:hypothetical protein
LNGTAAGISNAISAAASAADNFHYQYNRLPIPWSAGALRCRHARRAIAWSDAAGASGCAGRHAVRTGRHRRAR